MKSSGKRRRESVMIDKTLVSVADHMDVDSSI